MRRRDHKAVRHLLSKSGSRATTEQAQKQATVADSTHEVSRERVSAEPRTRRQQHRVQFRHHHSTV